MKKADCACTRPQGRAELKPWRDLDWDTTDGRFADVTILECQNCGRLWLRYFVEYEAFSRSGRWAMGEIDPETAMIIRPEEASQYLAGLPYYIRGGSYFGKVEIASGYMRWAP